MCITGQMPRDGDDPITIGHEATGEVVQVGSQVRGFQEGDSVGFVNAYHACWSCKGCKGHFMLCSDARMRMQGFNADGYFQEYCVVDAASAVVLPKEMDAQESAPIFCAGITGMIFHTDYRTTYSSLTLPFSLSSHPSCRVTGWRDSRGYRLWRLRTIRYELYSRTLISKLQPLIAFEAIRYARAKGYKVIGIDIDNETLETARSSGAEHIYNSRLDNEYTSKILDVTSGGCDAVAVFSAAKVAYQGAPKILATGGNLVCVGLPSQNCEFSVFDISVKKYHLRGAGNSATPAQLRDCAAFTARHGITSPQKYFQLDQIVDMISTLTNGKTGGQRLVVRF